MATNMVIFLFFIELWLLKITKKEAHDFITFFVFNMALWLYIYIYIASQNRAVLLIPQIARMFAPRHRLCHLHYPCSNSSFELLSLPPGCLPAPISPLFW
jgi:hypothetical protein